MSWILTANDDATEFTAYSEEHAVEFVADSWEELYEMMENVDEV